MYNDFISLKKKKSWHTKKHVQEKRQTVELALWLMQTTAVEN